MFENVASAPSCRPIAGRICGKSDVVYRETTTSALVTPHLVFPQHFSSASLRCSASVHRVTRHVESDFIF